jgi:hypothetical protein
MLSLQSAKEKFDSILRQLSVDDRVAFSQYILQILTTQGISPHSLTHSLSLIFSFSCESHENDFFPYQDQLV